jgi:hypothetical protein
MTAKTPSAILAYLASMERDPMGPKHWKPSNYAERVAAQALARNGRLEAYRRDETVHFDAGSMTMTYTYYRLPASRHRGQTIRQASGMDMC